MSTLTFKDFRNNVRPNWCPGCGDFSIQMAIQRAVADLSIAPERFALVTGIGCSGRISSYIKSYGYHGIHGRALPIAQGVKLANKDLTVIVAGGDGDGFAIGLGHTVHAMRRNIDLTYIVMDNQVYGLTKGQTSPRSEKGFVTSTSPEGAIEQPLFPMEIALTSGASFVAQSFSSDIKELTEIIKAGILHRGFSIINVHSPCVTYNKVNTYEWFREHLVSTDDIAHYDSSDRQKALNTLLQYNNLVTGILYQEERSSYQALLRGYSETPLAHHNLVMEESLFTEILNRYM